MANLPGTGRKVAIVVGGGPAPGINGVIAAVTIEAIHSGYEVIGCQDGFKHLAAGSSAMARRLTAADVEPFALRGGSMLGTARTNPTRKPEDMAAVLGVFDQLGVTDLVTIGGDDTAYTASQVVAQAGGKIRVAHVPKTIDNDLPLAGTTPTFGYETARHYGTMITRAMIEDARTTSRWYVVISMGRAAGHLALGIGRASAAQLTLIPEEFGGQAPTLEQVGDIALGSILKRKAAGLPWGVVVMAEGLIERIGVDGLIGALGGEDQLARYGNVVKDDHGNLRMAEIQFGRLMKEYLEVRLREFGQTVTLVAKDVGYELRCIDPVPFDCEYTRELGFAAVQFLMSPEADEFGAIISVEDGRMEPLKFEDKLDPATRRMSTRQVDVQSLAFRGAIRFMDRLEPEDFHDEARLAQLAETASMSPEMFRERFGHLAG